MRSSLLFLALTAVGASGALAAASCAETATIDDLDASAPPLDVGAPPPDPDGAADSGRDALTVDATDAPADAPKDGPRDAASDAASSDTVRISELFIDPGVNYGDGAEFVELRGEPGTPVDDLRLRLIHGDTGVKYDVAVGTAGQVIGATGTWVVGGGSVFKIASPYRVDTTVSLVNWGLASTGSVQLVRGPGLDLVDVVGYGAVVAPPGTAPTKTLEGATPVPAPQLDKHSIGRRNSDAGATDTDDNSADFCQMQATPGRAQAACVP